LLKTPEDRSTAMDALSDVLRVVRLKGGVFLHAEFTAPWCILSHIGPEDCGSSLEGAEHLMLYHYVVEGRLAAQIPGAKPLEIEAGEVVMFPHNHKHLLGSHLDLSPVPARGVMQALPGGGLS
jgi:mannose-6-phosphate isomerase-like protein (cupin superfamily)